MSYLRHSGLGQVASPEDVRFQEMVNFVIAKRKGGKSDDAIFVLLSASGGLDKSHPCAGPRGENLCRRLEIDRAIASAGQVAVEQEKAAAARRKPKGGSLFTPRNLIIAGVATVAILALTRRS